MENRQIPKQPASENLSLNSPANVAEQLKTLTLAVEDWTKSVEHYGEHFLDREKLVSEMDNGFHRRSIDILLSSIHLELAEVSEDKDQINKLLENEIKLVKTLIDLNDSKYLQSCFDSLCVTFKKCLEKYPLEKLGELKTQIFLLLDRILYSDCLKPSDITKNLKQRFEEQFLRPFISIAKKNKIREPKALSDPGYQHNIVKNINADSICFIPIPYLQSLSSEQAKKLAKTKKNEITSWKKQHQTDQLVADKISVINCFLDFLLLFKAAATNCDKLIQDISVTIRKLTKKEKLPNSMLIEYLSLELCLLAWKADFCYFTGDFEKSTAIWEKEILTRFNEIAKQIPKSPDTRYEAILRVIATLKTNYTFNSQFMCYFKTLTLSEEKKSSAAPTAEEYDFDSRAAIFDDEAPRKKQDPTKKNKKKKRQPKPEKVEKPAEIKKFPIPLSTIGQYQSLSPKPATLHNSALMPKKSELAWTKVVSKSTIKSRRLGDAKQITMAAVPTFSALQQEPVAKISSERRPTVKADPLPKKVEPQKLSKHSLAPWAPRTEKTAQQSVVAKPTITLTITPRPTTSSTTAAIITSALTSTETFEDSKSLRSQLPETSLEQLREENENLRKELEKAREKVKKLESQMAQKSQSPTPHVKPQAPPMPQIMFQTIHEPLPVTPVFALDPDTGLKTLVNYVESTPLYFLSPSAKHEFYFSNQLQEMQIVKYGYAGEDNQYGRVFGELYPSYAMTEEQAIYFCDLINKSGNPITVEDNLLLTNHKLQSKEVIKYLAETLSSPNIQAPKISFESVFSNNNFLQELVSNWQPKYDPDSYLNSLVQLDFTESDLKADVTSQEALKNLLEKNPMLVVIDFDPKIKKYFDRDEKLNNLFKIHKENFVNMVTKLIINNNSYELEIICRPGNDKLVDILRPCLTTLEGTARENDSVACLEILKTIPLHSAASIPKSPRMSGGDPRLFAKSALEEKKRMPTQDPSSTSQTTSKLSESSSTTTTTLTSETAHFMPDRFV